MGKIEDKPTALNAAQRVAGFAKGNATTHKGLRLKPRYLAP
jgi:hypothetical protein